MAPHTSTCPHVPPRPPTLLLLQLLLLVALPQLQMQHATDAAAAEGFEAAGAERGAAGRPPPRYSCPSDFVRHGSSCYLLSAHMATWFDAHFACKDRGGELALLEKGWEDRNMRSYLNKPELARLERWIGGIYNWETQRWVWGAQGGQPLKYQGFSQMAKGGRPHWHCIVMDPLIRYKWGARLCLQRKHYICEVPLLALPNPHPQAVRVTPPQPHAASPRPRQGDAPAATRGKETQEERRRRRRERRKQRQLQRQRQKQRQKERLRQRQRQKMHSSTTAPPPPPPPPAAWGGVGVGAGAGQPYRLLHVSPDGLPYREEVLL